MASPTSVSLYLTRDWQIDEQQRPIGVEMTREPAFPYEDPEALSGDPPRRGVFVARFDMPVKADPDVATGRSTDVEALAVFFSATYGIKEVQLNGYTLKSQSPTDPRGSLAGFGPAAYVIPDGVLRAVGNEMRVLNTGNVFKVLPAFQIGALDAVLTAHRWGRLFAFDLALAATAMLLFMALLVGVSVWPAADRPQAHALLLLLLAYSLRNFAVLGLYDSLPLSVTRVATYISNFLPLLAFPAFALIWADVHSPSRRFRRLALSLIVIVPVVLVAFDLRRLPVLGNISIPWMLDNVLTVIAMSVTIVVFAWGSLRASPTRRFEALLFTVCASALLVDKLDSMFHLTVPFAELPLTFYFAPMCGLLIALGMCATIAAQTSRARVQEQTLNAMLERRLADSQAEIQRQAQRHARLAERRRIMRDMHDGLGGQLTALAAELSDPEIERAVLADRVQDSIAELRLIVDSLDTEGDSLPVALGSLRARLASAFRAAGIEVDWQVADVPSPTLEAGDILEVFRILQTACANVLQHSGANRVQIALESARHGVELSVIDNGRGLPEARPEHQGIRNMRTRAQRLGGQLRIESGDLGVSVVLRLPATRT